MMQRPASAKLKHDREQGYRDRKRVLGPRNADAERKPNSWDAKGAQFVCK